MQIQVFIPVVEENIAFEYYRSLWIDINLLLGISNRLVKIKSHQKRISKT